MAGRNKLITCFEHDTLKLGQQGFEERHLTALQQYYGNGKTDTFSLVHKGVKFNQFVGVLQVKGLTLEVLPKIDRQEGDQPTYRRVLLQMLRESGLLDVRLSEQSRLRLRDQSILELYIDLFVQECAYLLRHGLLKQYRKQSGNRHALKGALQFQQHIRDNLIHRERFHTRHTVYDAVNRYNQVLYKTLRVLDQMPVSDRLSHRIGALILNFPEMPDIRVDEAFFRKLRFTRKTEPYRQALSLARLILLNQHPDVRSGSHGVFALMFDMNVLWEQWVLSRLKQQLPEAYQVQGQTSTLFWQSPSTNKALKPDIVIRPKHDGDGRATVIDTKWKTPDHQDGPSDEDLRQIYAYLHYFDASEGILLYPGQVDHDEPGAYREPANLSCRQVFRAVVDNHGKATFHSEALIRPSAASRHE